MSTVIVTGEQTPEMLQSLPNNEVEAVTETAVEIAEIQAILSR